MKLLFLGTAQDAGVPQIGCNCSNCKNARNNKEKQRLGPSIAIFNDKLKYCYLIDASPDIKEQIQMIKQHIPEVKINQILPISGIFLTHAHYGHLAGLWSLGKECINAKEIITFCSEKLSEFLKTNHPFCHLFEQNNLTLFSMKLDYDYPIENFRIRNIKVPHRDEYGDTVAYLIASKKRILYLPDIDYWTDEIIDVIHSVDIAIIDGTFYSKDELSTQLEVPHPSIKESMEKLDPTKTIIYFTHFNHTNPILKDRKLLNEIKKKGFKIATDGLILEI